MALTFLEDQTRWFVYRPGYTPTRADKRLEYFVQTLRTVPYTLVGVGAVTAVVLGAAGRAVPQAFWAVPAAAFVGFLISVWNRRSINARINAFQTRGNAYLVYEERLLNAAQKGMWQIHGIRNKHVLGHVFLTDALRDAEALRSDLSHEVTRRVEALRWQMIQLENDEYELHWRVHKAPRHTLTADERMNQQQMLGRVQDALTSLFEQAVALANEVSQARAAETAAARSGVNGILADVDSRVQAVTSAAASDHTQELLTTYREVLTELTANAAHTR